VSVSQSKFGGDKKLWSRRRIMFLASITFYRYIAKHVFVLMRAQGLAKSPLAWLQVLNYAFGSPGLMRRIVPLINKYYRKDFHPNDIDDSAELARGRRLVGAFA